MIKNILWFLLFGSLCLASFTEPDRAIISIRNLLTNPGWESSKAGWSVSAGTYTTTTTAANVGSGNAAASWATGASTRTLTSTAVTIPPGLYGKSGVVSCNIKGATAAHTLAAYDGSNTLASTSVSLSSGYIRTSVNFIFPSSGSISIRVTSASSETLFFDDCYIGDATGYNLSQTSQAMFIGSATFATTASCEWARNNTSYGAFGTTAACPGPTVESNPGPGTIQTTDADLPKVTVNNLPPGRYRVSFQGEMAGSSSIVTSVTINDGTTSSGRASQVGSTVSGFDSFNVEGFFEYTTAGNRTFELYGSSSGGSNILIENDVSNRSTRFSIYRYPNANDTIYRAETQAFAWSGYHDQDCTFARTTTGSFGAFVADATCTFTERTNLNAGTVTSQLSGSDKLPGIVITLPSAGTYEVCATPNFEQGANGADCGIRIVESSTVIGRAFKKLDSNNQDDTHAICGLYTATSSGSKTFNLEGYTSSTSITILSSTSVNTSVEWTVKKISQNMPAPNIVNSVTNSSSGVSGIEAAKLNCDSSSAITSQHGSWVSSIGNISAGACTVTLTSGIFSATPYCIASDTSTNPVIISANATSSTSVAIDCDGNDGTDCTAFDATLMCFGAK